MRRIFLCGLLLLTGFIYAQEEQQLDEDLDWEELGEVILVGSRKPNRTKTTTPVAVDVVSMGDIQESAPQLNVQDILNFLIPSFNAVRQSESDGTEAVEPVTLRGMGPDQVLVLINGKRRHATSLVNYQNTVGNGSVGTDLSTIPVAAIDRIEVLRDGAAAQYGSDAIAGVINIILKKNQGTSASLTYGRTGRNDGENVQADLHHGFSLGKEKSFLDITAQFTHRGRTNRTQHHDLDIFGDNFAYPFADDPAAARAADDALMSEEGLTRDDFDFIVGDAQFNQGAFFLNGGYPINEKWDLYTFGGLSFKNVDGSAFRRLPSETENVVEAIFPYGFQPIIRSQVSDFSYAIGTTYQYADWLVDISNTIGSNTFSYDIKNTNNASLGSTSPTDFDAGKHSFLQNTFNVDVSKSIEAFNIAFGAEWRFEQYQIKAGEEASYAQYDKDGDRVTDETLPEDILGAGGAQGFTGFSPLNAVKKSRNSAAAYLDLAYDIDRLNIDLAGRFEHYSDFGSAMIEKLALRYELFSNFSARAAVGTGFRAPSLHQQYFNNSFADISTSGSGIVNKGIFNNESEVARALGIDQLKKEKSFDFSGGLTYKPNNDWFITLDGYYIKVNDRIVLTSQFEDPIFQDFDVESGRFFTNAVDTRTHGIDLVVSYDLALGAGNLDINLAGNYTKTKITDFHFPAGLKGERDEFFGPDQINIIEALSPKTKASLGLNYNLEKWNFMLRNTYFGTVETNGFPFGELQKFEPKIVTDASVSYAFTKNLKLTIGANNLLDVFPDRQIYDNAYYNVFEYAPVQMGFNGSYFFGRLKYSF